MNDVEPFIIPEPKQPPRFRFAFPVRIQLLILGGVLILIFSGIFTPTLSPKNTITPTASALPQPIQTSEVVVGSIDPDDITISATSAFVYDAKTGRTLYEKSPDTVLPLASITKVMTALVAYELVPDDTIITITTAAAMQESGGSLQAGEQYAIKELADFALISSYNSAAYTLAAEVGELLGDRDPVQQFVAAMNIKADELALASLDYKNPTGLDISATEPGAIGSARDVSMLMNYVLSTHPDILLPTTKPTTRLYTQDRRYYYDAVNTNESLVDMPHLLGSKTGYTDLAGGNLTIAFDAGLNRPVIITVLGSTRTERFTDTQTLIAATRKIFSRTE